jgi:hypothetical protein
VNFPSARAARPLRLCHRLPPRGCWAARTSCACWRPGAGRACGAPRAAFGQRLSEWFSWTDAIALSSALGGPAEPVPAGLLTAAERLAVETRELARVRQQLLGHIRGEPAGARPPGGAGGGVAPRAGPAGGRAAGRRGLRPHRQRCLAVQKAMDNAIGALRQRVRDAVAAASPALAHLATLDVVMEDVVGAQASGPCWPRCPACWPSATSACRPRTPST